MSKKTLKNLILSIIIFCITLGSFLFMLYQIEKMSNLLKTLIETINTQMAQQDTFLNLEKIAKSTESKRADISEYFLKQESESINFLSLVEQKAPTMGVRLETESLKKNADQSGKSQWIEVDFTLTGTEERVQLFIKVLENVPYVSELPSVDLTMINTNEWQAKVMMKVFIMAYDS